MDEKQLAKKEKKDPCLKIPKMERKKIGEEKKIKKSFLKRKTPKILQQSSVDIQKLLTGSLRTKTTRTPLLKQLNLNLFCLTGNFLGTLIQIITA